MGKGQNDDADSRRRPSGDARGRFGPHTDRASFPILFGIAPPIARQCLRKLVCNRQRRPVVRRVRREPTRIERGLRTPRSRTAASDPASTLHTESVRPPCASLARPRQSRRLQLRPPTRSVNPVLYGPGILRWQTGVISNSSATILTSTIPSFNPADGLIAARYGRHRG